MELEEKRYFLHRDISLLSGPPSKFGISEDPWVVGMFLAEGNVTFKRSHAAMQTKKPYALDFAQNDGETKEELVRVLRGMNLDPKVYSKRVIINSLELGERFHQLFGRYAHHKALPPDFISYELPWIADCLAGIIDGDGTVAHCEDGPDCIGIDTTSFALAQQIAFMAMRLGITPSILATTVRPLTRHQGFRVRFRMTAQACLFLKRSFKVQKIQKMSPDQEPEWSGHSLLSTNREVSYQNEFVYDLTTVSGVLYVGGLLSHNSGGVAGAKGSQTVGWFDRLNQLLNLPKKLPGAAILSEHEGKVDSIKKDPAGGWDIVIKGEKHYAPGSRELLVKMGDTVKKGDALTTGPKNPREMLKLTGLNSVQSYLVNEIQSHYKNSAPLSRRNTETFVRAMTNLSVVKDPGDHPDYLRGDHAASSELTDFNRKLPSGKKMVEHEPILSGVDILPLDLHEDWIARLQSRNLRQTLIDAASEGWRSELHSTHPIPGMAYAKEFGRGTDKEPWLY
jgi:hypothetical protein